MSYPDVGKLQQATFDYMDVRIVVYNLVHALSPGGDPEFYAEDESIRNIVAFYLNDGDLERNSATYSKLCQPNFDSLLFEEHREKNPLIERFLQ